MISNGLALVFFTVITSNICDQGIPDRALGRCSLFLPRLLHTYGDEEIIGTK